jgi:hypothetical protein
VRVEWREDLHEIGAPDRLFAGRSLGHQAVSVWIRHFWMAIR